jgi:DNA-binding NarL/FixJ family response regulator
VPYDNGDGDVVNSPIRVVIVDDTDDLRALLRAWFAREPDIEVVAEGADGDVAAQLAAEHDADVVVLDMLMPTVTGLEALPEIKATRPEAAVIMYSSTIADHLERAAIELGADAYLAKSAAWSELVRHVRQFGRR